MKPISQITAKLAMSALHAFDDALSDWKPDAIKAYGLDLAVERMRDAIAAQLRDAPVQSIPEISP